MSNILDTDRAVAVVTYALSSLAIYWGCKRSVANDYRTPSTRERIASSASPSSWAERCLFVLTVIIAVGGLGALSHLIVYLTSRELQNWAFAVTAVFQITLAIFKGFGEIISANSDRLPLSSPLYKLRPALLPLAGGLSIALVLGVYNGHQWIQGLLAAIVVFTTIRWIGTIPIGGMLVAGFLFISDHYSKEQTPTQNSGPQDTGYNSSESKLLFAMNFSTMSLALPGSLLATTLQYEHSKAEEHEKKLAILPWRFTVDSTMFTAASQIFFFEMLLLAGAEILAPESTLRYVRGMNVICATSLPVVVRLLILARRGGVYEEYMIYPNKKPGVEIAEGSDSIKADA